MILTRQHVHLTGHLPLTLWQVDAGVNTYAHKHVSTPLTNITSTVKTHSAEKILN